MSLGDSLQRTAVLFRLYFCLFVPLKVVYLKRKTQPNYSSIYFFWLLLFESMTCSGVQRDPKYGDFPTSHPGTSDMMAASCCRNFVWRMRYSRSASFCNNDTRAYFSCRSNSFCSFLFVFPAPSRENPNMIATPQPKNNCQPFGPRAPLTYSTEL